jgi:AcrR family transcriptional regulator
MVQVKNERRSKNNFECQARPATALRHQDLREDLIRRAGEAIEAQGLAQLRARDLAAQAGCALGAIYNVFDGMDGLVLEVNARTLRAIDAEMARIAKTAPLAQLLALADTYLTYAVRHRLRWDALFNHRMPLGSVTPEWFLKTQDQAFSHIEAPLSQLRPDMKPGARRLLGRSIFAAVHGMVALGVDKRLAPIELTALRSQIATVVAAIVHGLAAIDLSREHGDG